MKAPVDFYFDFSSPYGYLASWFIDDIAARHGREVNWRPILLGPVFQHSGNSPLVNQPLKGAYVVRDFPRTARYLKVPFVMPTPFPIATVPAARAFYWLHDREPAQAKALARSLFVRFYGEGRDISAADVVIELAGSVGADTAALAAALGDPAVKERLKREVDAAIAKGVCGSPYFIVDGEPFWGSDRLGQVEDWLRTGGW
ncbi:MAG: 2-hydroxychromene-2-carboxylate isomerase [Betaproteobacteria bacterium]|nr:2-hydroxychromene-2-carboxylate isomerase [Betaproteobacteria bacterium]